MGGAMTLFTMDLEGRVLPLLAELERLLGGDREQAVEVAAKAGSILGVETGLLRFNFNRVVELGLSQQQARELLIRVPAIFKWDFADRTMQAKLAYYERELGIPPLELLVKHGGYLSAALSKVDRRVRSCIVLYML